MVHKPALLSKLQRLGIKGHLAHYLFNFLSQNRRFQVKHRSIFSTYHELENGLPQGSCLSPTLFNIMIDDLFDGIPSDISFSLFADDSAIWCTSRDPDIGVQRLQGALNVIERWSRTNGLEFSAPKSAFMIFTKNNRLELTHHPQLNDVPIPLVSSFKFLGVILDRRLSMTHHIRHIQIKCKKRLNLFRCLTGAASGADRSTLLRLYKAIVLPIIEYGSVVYAGGSRTNLLKLEAVQNNFIRLALGAMRTSPIHSLQVEAHILPLHIRRIELTLRYYTKIKQHPAHAAYASTSVLPRLHFSYLGRCERRTGLTIASRVKKYQDDIGYVLPSITPLPQFFISPWTARPLSTSFLLANKKHTFSADEIQQTFLEYQAAFPHFQFVFTDGSKLNNTVGVGIFASTLPETKLRLQNDLTVHYAELYGISHALQLVKQHNIQKACICSDSKSAILSLQRPDITQHIHLKILDIHQQLIEREAEIRFLWVPGHSGISGNETADRFAKQALALQHITETPYDYCSIRASITYHCYRYWQRIWDIDGAGTQLHIIKPLISNWSSSNRHSRKEEKATIILGYFNFSSLFSFK
ncbi:uncharacterized protein LOC122371432 [Amphibalanus amphitrite]|uniref:uncharacterized protein LOC122371432 n=1 Tax=Amphibalanus amphitrite TaxID=1232801 RepID=UPI001C91C00F|nr:uncharacterized protein LOC122371432 [Amphibalanus amphitrite]